jgi:hypothetical protein
MNPRFNNSSGVFIRKDGLLAIWRVLTTEPVWKYQELPPFLLPELMKLDLVEASDSELSRVMWFWLRRPRLTLHESTEFIVVALCVLLSLTIAFVDWPLTSMMKRDAELMILVVGVAVQIYAVVHRFGFLRWRQEYEIAVDRLIRTIHPTV